MSTPNNGEGNTVAMGQRVSLDGYDRGILPSEVAERHNREGDAYKQIPEPSQAEQEADMDTTGGYTVSREGLLNNYAVEPEMYYEVPGDRSAKIEQEKREREQHLRNANDTDEDGKLSPESDQRGKGPGLF